MTVTLFSKPSCVQCTATARAFKERGIAHVVRDLSEEVDALELVKGLGYMQAPVVVTDDEHWSGFRPDRINELAERIKEGGDG
ncbi:glutaredoxin-like protein NrdH [Leucobacter rhizosphaerae]|uniref:Glutaredoxin-like protein NrdH n=1 Tax=Leucobacter rhizosphaerae TaxID=2932245 RepID=A0ABY4FVP6_9MICO|nr:glutaredoxin-like protein NrdH [Leucobacter rhizosphaerae]UOQ60360.1 glutaredoxin-like protein NrdH [Leucobacter rhizosphaerae]